VPTKSIEEYSLFDIVGYYQLAFRRFGKFHVFDMRSIKEYSIAALIFMPTPLRLISDHPTPMNGPDIFAMTLTDQQFLLIQSFLHR
jgi:hypothetical protein